MCSKRILIFCHHCMFSFKSFCSDSKVCSIYTVSGNYNSNVSSIHECLIILRIRYFIIWLHSCFPAVLILMKSPSKEPTWGLLLVIFCLGKKGAEQALFFGLWLIQNLYRENQGYNQYRYPSLLLMSWFQITLLQSRQTRALFLT